jgi:hypothetical protein
LAHDGFARRQGAGTQAGPIPAPLRDPGRRSSARNGAGTRPLKAGAGQERRRCPAPASSLAVPATDNPWRCPRRNCHAGGRGVESRRSRY